MPERRVQIFPIDGNPVTLYSDENWGGQTSVMWIDEAQKHWQCNLAQSEFSPVCGLAAELTNNNTSLDLSVFTSLSLQLKYTGDASKLRIYLRNHNPAYSNPEDPDSFKFNSVNLPAKDFAPKETIIHLSEFSVENWWIEERNIPRHLVHPELNNIMSIGLDYPYPQVLGEHNIEMSKIELIGPLFPKEPYFVSVSILWLLILSGEALAVFVLFRQKKLAIHQPIKKVTKKTPIQKPEKDAPVETLSKNDLTLKINAVFSNDKSRKNASLILFKVDHFQQAVNTHGEKVVDAIMLTLHSLTTDVFQKSDAFARWGEEEFLIFSTNTHKEAALNLAEKLRLNILNSTFEFDHSIKANLSIGGTSVVESDDFASAFMRAEQALYKASNDKHNGIHWIDGK